MQVKKIYWIQQYWSGGNKGGYKMKTEYEQPILEIVDFETNDMIAASGDYAGIDFEDLI